MQSVTPETNSGQQFAYWCVTFKLTAVSLNVTLVSSEVDFFGVVVVQRTVLREGSARLLFGLGGSFAGVGVEQLLAETEGVGGGLDVFVGADPLDGPFQ